MLPVDQAQFRAINVVVMAVPDLLKGNTGKERGKVLSRVARYALGCSAELSGLKTGDFRKNKNGVPVPTNDVYWSLSHAVDYVAAVAAPQPVGIDLEKIGAFSPLLQGRIADEREWLLVPVVTPRIFCTYWTAKEAVLKAEGVGLGGLDECRVLAFAGKDRMNLGFKSSRWTVRFRHFPAEHIVALTCCRLPIIWTMLPAL